MSASTAVWYMLAGLAIWSATRALHGALIVRRSRTWKLAVTVAGLGLGTAPTLDGQPGGYALITAGALASASLLSEVAERRGWFAPRRTHNQRCPADPDLAPDGPTGGLTELDQAAVHRTALSIQHDRLERAAVTADLTLRAPLPRPAAFMRGRRGKTAVCPRYAASQIVVFPEPLAPTRMANRPGKAMSI